MFGVKVLKASQFIWTNSLSLGIWMQKTNSGSVVIHKFPIISNKKNQLIWICCVSEFVFNFSPKAKIKLRQGHNFRVGGAGNPTLDPWVQVKKLSTTPSWLVFWSRWISGKDIGSRSRNMGVILICHLRILFYSCYVSTEQSSGVTIIFALKLGIDDKNQTFPYSHWIFTHQTSHLVKNN